MKKLLLKLLYSRMQQYEIEKEKNAKINAIEKDYENILSKMDSEIGLHKKNLKHQILTLLAKQTGISIGSYVFDEIEKAIFRISDIHIDICHLPMRDGEVIDIDKWIENIMSKKITDLISVDAIKAKINSSGIANALGFGHYRGIDLEETYFDVSSGKEISRYRKIDYDGSITLRLLKSR